MTIGENISMVYRICVTSKSLCVYLNTKHFMIGQMERTDQDVLIPNNRDKNKINPVVLYAITKAIPYLVHLFLCATKMTSFNIFVVTVLLLIGDYWFNQNIHGLQLVGLRWWIEIGHGFNYYSKPDPFVPLVSNSNAFWLGFFISIFVWIITAVVTLFTHGLFISVIAVIGAILSCINLYMFVKAHKQAKIDAEHACLTMLQDENINFELVKEELDDNTHDLQSVTPVSTEEQDEMIEEVDIEVEEEEEII